MAKTNQLQSFKNNLAKTFQGHTVTESQDLQRCVMCDKPAVSFRDGLSAKEYCISGMCQKCQDEVFGV